MQLWYFVYILTIEDGLEIISYPIMKFIVILCILCQVIMLYYQHFLAQFLSVYIGVDKLYSICIDLFFNMDILIKISVGSFYIQCKVVSALLLRLVIGMYMQNYPLLLLSAMILTFHCCYHILIQIKTDVIMKTSFQFLFAAAIAPQNSSMFLSPCPYYQLSVCKQITCTR